MISANGLTTENMLRTLPSVLRNDSAMLALGTTIANVLSARPAEIDKLTIYAAIDRLPSPVLDILAQDFKVDWWDADYSLEEKRNTLKQSWHVHRTLGTKGAVETAISAIYPNTKVSEWFSYNGMPYHYKLLLDVTYESVAPSKHARVVERVAFYQNLRSVLDGIEYVATPEGVCSAYCAVGLAGMQIQITTEVAVYGLE